MAEPTPTLGPLVEAVQEQIAPITVRPPGEGDPAPARPRWNPATRIAFRFFALYFFIYFLPFPVSLVPRLAMPALQYPDLAVLTPLKWLAQGAGYLMGQYDYATQQMAFWAGKHILGLQEGAIVVQRTGSGDTMLNYVKAFCFLGIAATATLLWSVIDRRRPSYTRLHAAFHICVRYALAMWLLSYGFAKVPPMQFSPPGPDRLLSTYGQSSPMGLLWTFMGASPAYTIFAGIAEIIPGVLLLFRRTRTLGAILAAAVMLNVVLLNFCYDVPVKLFSGHLLIASLVLIAPDSRRLLNLLVLNRPAPPAKLAIEWPRRWMRRSAHAIKACVILGLVAGGAWGAYLSWQTRGWNKNLPALYGAYEVESFKSAGEEVPPLLTDKTRWRRFVVTRWGSAFTLGMDDRRQFYGLQHDADAKSLKLTGGRNDAPLVLGEFACTENESGWLVLDGEMSGKPVSITLRKLKDEDFFLKSRGFNWIQEMPVNR